MENNLNVEIVERDPKSFAFHPSNPRDHSDESVARLAESIQEDPLYFRGRPILLSDRTGELVVIGGEGRTRAALLLGLDSVPSVVFHGLTEEDEIRIMQKDNSHTGKWNKTKLKELVSAFGERYSEYWEKKVLKNNSWTQNNDNSDCEIKFAEYLRENHNYIVLYFDNDVDWLQLTTLFNIPRVKLYHRQKDCQDKGEVRYGQGRVFKWREFFEAIKKHIKDENIG